MRVHIGPYTNWVGPYQIAEKILFWMDKHNDNRVHAFGEFLAHGFHKETESESRSWRMNRERPTTWLYDLCTWIESKKKRKVEIHIDRWDTWSMDSTLSPIILPMLKQLKETKHGSGMIDLEDVPEHMRGTNTEDYEDQKCFEFYHEKEIETAHNIHTRYEWVLDQMIWSFEQLQPDCDWEDQYRSGEHDIIWVPSGAVDAKGEPLSHEMTKGPEDTYVCDYDAMAKHQERINVGLRLFGKYYQTLWD